ncbi:cytochrome c oxidase assembly protein subunit 15 [Arcticibacter tournemirensis]|uniref:Heme A synthase n=1 Tax=Arcticibacter tournemirensis TaxID=699437 RepID=A0A5M9H8S2_9SPHI|nr:COX15/CtaA family protein [Arcticibacter tournemirensis]KAA8483333.1 heme A synthase [Arcticibacter tournemirensis]TQM50979.1 cytochrome c oxidase assembly protein subunit 15 [Arcticibacter tournemirensis]
MDTISLKKNRPVAIWLLVGAGMIIIQVLLGGITRLTGSGLSITEWQPILGTLPPMNEKAWQEAFEKYQQIAQFKYINSHFTLSDFKSIYFWEWFHRDWGRLMGVVFIIPFVYFLVKKKINRSMIHPMIILFLLGGLQGIIGWIMVQSGIGTDLVYVSHIRLAVHFIAALILLCYVVWFALKITVPQSQLSYAPAAKSLNVWLLVLLTIQLVYGAFMAGTHAALAAPTWPSINGMWWPADYMLTQGSFSADITHNLISIQFIHRNLAYLITILVFWWTFKVSRLPQTSTLYKLRFMSLILVIIQVTLGVLALLNSVNDYKLLYSILHQFVGILLLLSLLITYYFSLRIKIPVKAAAVATI